MHGSLDDLVLRLGRVVPTETELVVEGLLSARAHLDLRPTQLLAAAR